MIAHHSLLILPILRNGGQVGIDSPSFRPLVLIIGSFLRAEVLGCIVIDDNEGDTG